MNIQPDFDPSVEVVVISLASAERRRRATSNMLRDSYLNWHYFDAHTAIGFKELSYDAQRARLHFGRVLTQPEIAVYSSHYAVWKEFVERGRSEFLLVMEDDLVIDTDFPVDRFARFCASFGLHYVRLFGKHYAPAVKLGSFYDRSVLRFRTSPAGTQAYLLTAHAARILLDNCRRIDATIDLAMDRFWKTGLPLYSIFPYPVIERFVPTSIPIPEGERGVHTKGELLRLDMHRAARKLRKIVADRRRFLKDARLRKQMPVFHQIDDEDLHHSDAA